MITFKNQFGKELFSCRTKLLMRALDMVRKERISLYGVDLSKRDLSSIEFDELNLECAQFDHSNLEFAKFFRANLARANFNSARAKLAVFAHANLTKANFLQADLAGAYLTHANLAGSMLIAANAQCAHFSFADLSNACLGNANFRDANFTNANLSGADLAGAHLNNAQFDGANLEGAMLPPFQICPTVGAFVAFKSAETKTGQIAVLTLEIPSLSPRTSVLGSRKCRAKTVRVVGSSIPGEVFYGIKQTEYRIGKLVDADAWDPDIRTACTHGIHFFMTYEEARDYV